MLTTSREKNIFADDDSMQSISYWDEPKRTNKKI